MSVPIALLDANVFYPAALRDFMVRLALTGLYRARWTDEIEQEWIRNVLADRPDLDPTRLERTRRLIRQAIPDGPIARDDALVAVLTLPDPADRHVLAAAIAADADAIVTFNLRDFPTAIMDAHGLVARHPDDFVMDLVDASPDLVVRAAESCRAAMANPPFTREDHVGLLERQGLRVTATFLRDMLQGD